MVDSNVTRLVQMRTAASSQHWAYFVFEVSLKCFRHQVSGTWYLAAYCGTGDERSSYLVARCVVVAPAMNGRECSSPCANPFFYQ